MIPLHLLRRRAAAAMCSPVILVVVVVVLLSAPSRASATSPRRPTTLAFQSVPSSRGRTRKTFATPSLTGGRVLLPMIPAASVSTRGRDEFGAAAPRTSPFFLGSSSSSSRSSCSSSTTTTSSLAMSTGEQEGEKKKSDLPMLLDPGTKGGALFLTLILLIIPFIIYNIATGVFGVDGIVAGRNIGVGFTVTTSLLWASTYVFRVATKDMTYAKQLKDYENAVIAKRLEELDEDEITAMMEDIEREEF